MKIHRHYHINTTLLLEQLTRIADALETFNHETFGITSPTMAEQAKAQDHTIKDKLTNFLTGKALPDEGDFMYTDHDEIAVQEELARRGKLPPDED